VTRGRDAAGTDLPARFERVEEALAEAAAAPLSARRARLAAMLLDDFADRAWAAWKASPEQVFGAEDVLKFRAALAGACAPMARVMALAEAGPGGPRLEVRAVAVPPEQYPALSVQDFMVSLYNGLTVMRVVLTDGRDAAEPAPEALPLLHAAADWWRQRV
jgi:hypothetical protein